MSSDNLLLSFDEGLLQRLELPTQGLRSRQRLAARSGRPPAAPGRGPPAGPPAAVTHGVKPGGQPAAQASGASHGETMANNVFECPDHFQRLRAKFNLDGLTCENPREPMRTHGREPQAAGGLRGRYLSERRAPSLQLNCSTPDVA